MPGFGVIADVSETLRDAIDEALSTLTPLPAPQAVVHNLQTLPPTNPPTLTIFLYEITEDVSTRNRPMRREETPAGVQLRKPPMTLLLRYLLTPFAGDVLTEQRMMGRTLQALYEHPIFSGPDLRGDAAPAGLVGSPDALKTTFAQLSLEGRTRVWHAIQRAYRLSVSYDVRVVNIEPEQFTSSAPVRSRRIDRLEPDTESA